MMAFYGFDLFCFKKQTKQKKIFCCIYNYLWKRLQVKIKVKYKDRVFFLDLFYYFTSETKSLNLTVNDSSSK